MKKIFLNIVLIALLLADVVYSFNQHYHGTLDGDMAQNILPTEDYKKVLEDPLAFNVLAHKSHYAAPNRFFAHWTVSEFFKTVPFLFQPNFNPIDSVYLSCALAKTGIQVLIIVLLASYISLFVKLKWKNWLIAAALVTPLFQTSGYNGYMGIIESSVTYTFFYTVPLGFLLLFFLPFFASEFCNVIFRLNVLTKIVLAFLCVVLTLNGPLIPGTVLIICPVVLFTKIRKRYTENPGMIFYKRILFSIKQIPKRLIFYFVLICILSMYSMYIGLFNTNNSYGEIIPLAERYARIPGALFDMLTQKIGFPLLLLFIGLNVFVIRRSSDNEQGKKILRLITWVSVLSLVYIALLPLGGSRSYRPGILRHDTVMPVTIALILIYGLSSFYLLFSINKKWKAFYITGVVLFSLIYTFADKPVYENVCERKSIEILANSSEEVVLLNSDCSVMAWGLINDYEESEPNALLFNYWGITKKPKLYYQK